MKNSERAIPASSRVRANAAILSSSVSRAHTKDGMASSAFLIASYLSKPVEEVSKGVMKGLKVRRMPRLYAPAHTHHSWT